MAYVPDPTDVTMPTDAISAETAQAEFRALKSYIAALAGLGNGYNLFRKNSLFNPKMDLGQRGTSFAQTAAGTITYTLDRWWQLNSAVGRTMTQQAAGPSNGFNKCLRISRDVGNAAVNVLQVGQALETIDCLKFAGASATLSFYARMGANFSAAAATLVSTVDAGEGTDQSAATQAAGTWTTQVASVQNNVLTAAFQRFSQVVAIGATKTQLGVRFSFTPVGVAGAADYVEVTGVQLEVAGVASPFEFRDQATELPLCQRYFEKTYDLTTAPAAVSGNGEDYMITPGVLGRWNFRFKVTKRIIPTITTYSPGSGAAANARNVTSAADVATGFAVGGMNGAIYTFGSVANNEYSVHWTADAEL